MIYFKVLEGWGISLNNSLFSLFRFREKDMFSHTQGRLTRIFSGLLILFLTLFIIMVYMVLYFTTLKSSESELETLAASEASFIESYLLENKKNDLQGVQNQEVVFAGVNQTFYYVINPSGKIILGNETQSRLRPAILTLLNNRIGSEDELFIETLHVEGYSIDKRRPNEFRHDEPDQDIHLMIASQPIYHDGQFIGNIYIGKDITLAYQLFRWVLVIFSILGIVFFGIAVMISSKMSKKAMIPINHAFQKQREFVADASHELRTPLSVLLSSIDAMDMTLEPEEKEFEARLLSNMRQEVKRMTRLVSDLLTLARSDSNTIELRKEIFDFRPLAEKAKDSVGLLANEKKISITLDGPDSLIVVGDPERLSQLLYILLDNAVKYTPNGGKVNLFHSKERKDFCMAVQDTGIGIEKKDFNQIFERFYRLDKSRSRQIGGHGLGLSIAKWIVDTHKGTIKVSSEMGKGSTFFVKIPGIALEAL
jgi:signal transduction histidine kinase